MTQVQKETLSELIADWRIGRNLLAEEMLRAALRPLIDLEASRYSATGVRRSDVEKAVWVAITQALEAYRPADGDIVSFLTRSVDASVQGMVDALRVSAARMRASSAGAKA